MAGTPASLAPWMQDADAAAAEHDRGAARRDLGGVDGAPTPVMTPQPTRLPISSGMSSSIFTALVRDDHLLGEGAGTGHPEHRQAVEVKCGVPPITIWMFEQRLGWLRGRSRRTATGRAPGDDHVVAGLDVW